jgi:hypothetical protein
VIPTGVRCYYRPVATVSKELGTSRDELRDLIGTSIVCADFEITFDRGDHLRFERVTRPVTPVGVPSVAAASSSAPAFKAGPDSSFDPAVVAKHAQEYQIAEQKAGREVSATEAVAHVLKPQAPAASQDARADPLAAERKANEARVAAQLAEVFARCRK